MKELRKIKTLFLIIFSLIKVDDTQGQINYTNNIVADFINVKYLDIIKLDSARAGFKVNKYDTLVIINSIEDKLLGCSGLKYIDSGIMAYLDKNVIQGKTIIFSDSIIKSYPCIYLRELTRTFYGYWGECIIGIKYSTFITPFYFSKEKKAITILDRTIHIMP